VALQLGIPFEVLDFQKEYKKKVIDYFYREYKAGRTPNPDVVCNREIKFGLFLQWALEKGFDFIATGHYARIARKEKGHATYRLLRGVDAKKDQSYFLYTLTQEQLKHVLFPVGEMTKQEVRSEAKKRGIVTADKPDSVGICFVGDVDVQKFLRRRIKEKRGVVVDTDGNVIGEHRGVWFYTIGQRHGFRINTKFEARNSKHRQAIPPYYVVGKDVTRNRLIVGFGPETYVDNIQVKDLHFINGMGRDEMVRTENLSVRIRHGGDLIPARSTIHHLKFMIHLDESQRGVAPGQAAVLYRGDECLGGGVIDPA
jgi:tRNA-specific 2-thiouridylase